MTCVIVIVDGVAGILSWVDSYQPGLPNLRQDFARHPMLKSLGLWLGLPMMSAQAGLVDVPDLSCGREGVT
jgi:hypothetical protein